MEVVKVLRELWRRRLLVGLVVALAVVVGGLAAYHVSLSPPGLGSRQYQVGIASARALVDTPNSQVVDLGVKEDTDSSVLPARAVLLANLLTTSPLRDRIAREAGVSPDRLLALADTPTDSGVPISAPLATGASVSPDDPRANVVKLHTDVSLPLITVNAQAPDAATAARLADGTVRVLTEYLASLSSDTQVPKDRLLVLKPLGGAHAATEQRGPSRALAVAAALLVFLTGCGAILLVSALARQWRDVAAQEALEHEPAPAAPDPPEGQDDPAAPDPPAEADHAGPPPRFGERRAARVRS